MNNPADGREHVINYLAAIEARSQQLPQSILCDAFGREIRRHQSLERIIDWRKSVPVGAAAKEQVQHDENKASDGAVLQEYRSKEPRPFCECKDCNMLKGRVARKEKRRHFGFYEPFNARPDNFNDCF